MVKTVPLTKCNTVTNYKPFFNCIQGGQLLRARGGSTPLTPPPDKYSPAYGHLLVRKELNESSGEFCWRIGDEHIVRTCSSKLNIRMSFALVCMSEASPNNGVLCFCRHDHCNVGARHSPLASAASVIAVAAAAVSIVLLRYVSVDVIIYTSLVNSCLLY